jgi:predicted DNA-binding protein
MADKLVYPIRLEREAYERLQRYAANDDRTVAQLIRRAVRKELSAIEAQEGKLPAPQAG